MRILFAAPLVGLIAQADAKITDPERIVEDYNHNRSKCNANTDLPDGIQARKKDMTTEPKYKNLVLADCDHLGNPEKKLVCI